MKVTPVAERRPYAWLPALIIVMTVVALGIGAVALRYIKTRLVATAGETLALAAADIAGKLDLLLDARYGDIQVMAQASAFQGGDRASMTRHLTALMDAYPVYQWMGVTDTRGRIIAATDPVAVGWDRSGTPWFQAVRDGSGIHVGDAAVSEESGGVMAVSFTAPIRSPGGAFLGVVTTRVGLPVLEDTLAQTANALQAQYGTRARIEYQFLQRDGTVIADSFLREEGTTNLKFLGLPSALSADSAQPGYIEEMHLRRQVPVVTGYAQTEQSGNYYGLHWGVLVRMDHEDILAPISAVLWNVGAAAALVFTPMLGVLLWATKSLRADRERLREQATHDPLTGLWNHSTILEALAAEFSRASREGVAVSVLMVDLDHFKRVNDTYGHAAGDQVLKETACRLRTAVRQYDLVGRVGGEEFLIVLPHCTAQGAAVIGERIRACIGEAPIETSKGALQITGSIGVATWTPDDQAAPGALLQTADKALYRAKHGGRNRVEYGVPDETAAGCEGVGASG